MAQTTQTAQATMDAIKYQKCRRKAALAGTDDTVCEKLKQGRMAKKKGGVVRAKVKTATKPRAKAKKANRIKASSDNTFSY